jgi:putative heme-binding domain-containing protein
VGRFDSSEAAQILISAWPTLVPRVQSAARDVLISRPQWVLALFDAIDAGELSTADLDQVSIKLLQTRREPEIQARLQKLAAQLKISSRQEVIDAYRPVLSLKGDAERGRANFRKLCSSCHRLENFGHEIGPNLASFKTRGAEAILLNVLDPNREVGPQFMNYIVILNDGRTLNGIIAQETATSISLRRAEGATDTIPRSEIDEMRSTRQSIMPEGIEKTFDPSAMADVIAYLLSLP